MFQCASCYATSGDVQLINYTQLPACVWQTFAEKVSLPLSAVDIQSMQARLLHHSRNPNEWFEATARNGGENCELLELANARYAELEQLRRAQSALSV